MATSIRNQKLFCDKCGGELALNFPIPMDEMIRKSEAFQELHKDCKQTWTEPKVDQSKDTQEKAFWWVMSGERGMSSITMFNKFMNRPDNDYRISHPYDPDDFSRCYKLLEAVPEWKSRLSELKSLSDVWSNLVDNWDKLTEMYEQNKKENWKNSKEIGMYEFMKKLVS